MPTPPRPVELISIAHYHHHSRRDPPAQPMADDVHCIELMTGGRGWVDHEGSLMEVLPGALLWHGPGERTIGRTDPDNLYRCLAVRVRVPPRLPRPVPRFSSWPELDEARALTRQLVRCFVDDRFDRAALMDYAWSRLRFQAELHHRLRPEPTLPAGLLRVLAVIEQDYARPLQLTNLADAAGWSPAHLHAMFKQHLDQTPHQALIARRLRAVRERLTSTNDPIKQISHDCGFTNAAALCRRFRLAMGATPDTYRQRHRDPARM